VLVGQTFALTEDMFVECFTKLIRIAITYWGKKKKGKKEKGKKRKRKKNCMEKFTEMFGTVKIKV
jgi:hypothetical protein